MSHDHAPEPIVQSNQRDKIVKIELVTDENRFSLIQ
jgi:hypothetical protein